MTDITPNLDLPLLASGQAQKEVYHNEALTTLDSLVLPVFAAPGDTPPAWPSIGAGWIVGDAPTGDWAGQANALAIRTDGGWRFLAVRPGVQLVLDDGRGARWTGSTWNVGDVIGTRVMIGGNQVLGARGGAIADPAGGATIDVQARAALADLLAAIRFHGLIAT